MTRSSKRMTDTIRFTINGRPLEADPGTTILEAAETANIYIPNLCSNAELSPYGACRLCMVEIRHGKRKRIVAACIYEVSEGLEVETETERVQNVQKLAIELLLSRNPTHPGLLNIASRLGVSGTRFEVDFKGCVLCGQCVRTCREVVGVSAIGFFGRGQTRKISTPFDKSPHECIACGSCAFICPVNVIPMEETDGIRKIWKTDFPMAQCTTCGKFFAPQKQIDYIRKITGADSDRLTKCAICRE